MQTNHTFKMPTTSSLEKQFSIMDHLTATSEKLPTEGQTNSVRNCVPHPYRTLDHESMVYLFFLVWKALYYYIPIPHDQNDFNETIKQLKIELDKMDTLYPISYLISPSLLTIIKGISNLSSPPSLFDKVDALRDLGFSEEDGLKVEDVMEFLIYCLKMGKFDKYMELEESNKDGLVSV